MSSVLAPFFIAFVLSVSLVPLCRRAAFRVGCVARPREDRWHRQATPLFGGAGICLAVFIVVLGFGRLDEVAVLAAAGALIFALGLTDDILTLKPSTKLIAQIALASWLLFFGYRLNWLESMTGDSLLTFLWGVGITKPFNL